MKKLLFLFSSLIFISCSRADNEITFLEKYDGVMFQSSYCNDFYDCKNPNNFQWNYISFHNENMFIREALDGCTSSSIDDFLCSSIGLICIQTISGISTEEFNGNEYEKNIDIVINLYDELKIKTIRKNLISQEIDSWYTRYLVKDDSLSIEIQSSMGENISDIYFYGRKHYRSLNTYIDICE